MTTCYIIQLVHSFEVNIRICQPVACTRGACVCLCVRVGVEGVRVTPYAMVGDVPQIWVWLSALFVLLGVIELGRLYCFGLQNCQV